MAASYNNIILLLCKPTEVQLCIWLTQWEKNYLWSMFVSSVPLTNTRKAQVIYDDSALKNIYKNRKESLTLYSEASQMITVLL